MKNDPIVEEVRETRRKRMAKFGNDPEVYWKHLRRRHVQHSDSYLSVQDLDHMRFAVAEPKESYGSIESKE